MTEAVLDFGNWGSVRGRATVAKAMEGHPPQSGARKSRVEGDTLQPVSAHRLAFGCGKDEVLIARRARQFPTFSSETNRAGMEMVRRPAFSAIGCLTCT
jgi:hypothetical protein